MRHLLSKVLLAGSFGLSCVSVATAESLHDVVAETVRSNPNVLIARNQRNAVEQEMEQARAGFFPSADITVGEGWESSNNPTTRATGHGRRSMNRTEMEITARQLLFDGFGTESEFDRQKARVNSRAYSTFGTSEVTGLRGVEVYLDVLRQEKLLGLAEENLATHERIYGFIRKRSERGVGRESDTQQTLGRLALAKTNLITARNSLRDASVAFQNVVGRPHAPAQRPGEGPDLLGRLGLSRPRRSRLLPLQLGSLRRAPGPGQGRRGAGRRRR